jgi:hypothetical protein
MLSGDVKDFAVRDVLQLLATTNKSGLLALHVAGGSGGVFVRNGDVCLALVDVTQVPLGHRIISAGLADADTVRATLRTADSSAFDVTCALLRAVSDADKARLLVAEHTRDSLGWLSQFPDARFEFDPTVNVEAWPLEPLATGEVLAEIEGGAEQWAELHSLVGDLSHVPHCGPGPKGAAEISLTALQWRVVALVDGHRSIRDLTGLASLGQLELYRELGGLARKGLVELVDPGGRRAIVTPLQDVEEADALSDILPEPAGEESHTPDVHPAIPDEPATVAADEPATVAADEPSFGKPLTTSQPSTIGDANVGLLNRLIGKSKGA